MSDAHQLLKMIEEHIVQHGGDLGGWTKLTDDSLQLFNGRVTLTAEIKDRTRLIIQQGVHTHIYTKLHDYDDEVLDACIFGCGDSFNAALNQAAANWMSGVAGPIKSLLDNKPICMTCQVGVAGGNPDKGYLEPDLGLTGVRAYVGPYLTRSMGNQQVDPRWFDEQKPWFRHVLSAAMPRRVHLAKVTVISSEKEGWYRDVEVDGHDTSFRDSDWPVSKHTQGFIYATRFAVFEFPHNSVELRRRTELERTIRYFVENFAKFEHVDQLVQHMVAEGFDPDVIHETESFAPMAFGRILYEAFGVVFPQHVIRARKSGRIKQGVPLLSIPAYNRARALAAELKKTMSSFDYDLFCASSPEVKMIERLMAADGEHADLQSFKLYGAVIPDRGVSDATFKVAKAILRDYIEQSRAQELKKQRKPWWKFW